MDKNDLVYREHSAKEHFILAAMILLAFAILTSQYNPDIWPVFTGTPTGAAAAIISISSFAIWGIILLLLIIGILAGIILWWANHKKIQVQRALQQGVDGILKTAGKSSKPITAPDPLARKLTKVQQELVDIPLRSATTGHVINTIPAEYQKILPSTRSLRPLFSRKVKVHKKAVAWHKVKHRQSLPEKMMQIQKEIEKVKTRE